MKPKNSRQRLFEVMGRLDKTFKPKLNEYDNYNYPAGADADPNAPWNQPPDPEFKEWEIYDEGDTLDDFTINFMDDQQGSAVVALQDILDSFVGSGDAEADATYDYFANAVKSPEMKASDEFKAKLDVAVEKYGELQNWEFSMNYPGPEHYEP